MHSIKLLTLAWILKERLKIIAGISLFIVLALSACGPAAVPSAPVEVFAIPTQIPATPTVEGTLSPTSSSGPEQVYPYYLPLATKPELAPQTIRGVTAKIDWVYVDESRVALHYTISGLDWPDGTPWDAMSVQVKSATVPNSGFGGGGWNSTLASHGIITGSSDQLLTDRALDADRHPNADLRVDIPVKGPSAIGTFHFKFNVPVMKGIRVENMDQTVVANNVSMTLKTFILNPSHAEALICFQMPSEMDWGLTASKIIMSGKEYPFSGGGLLAGTDGKNFRLTDPDRCTTVGFDIAYDKLATSITLTVPKLMASVPEVVTKERVAAANQKLAGTGIEFDYVSVDHGGNIVVLKRPEGATDEKIYPLIWEALADQYEGPWVFTISIKR
jgi:hypothetical protein